jgi:hypothetical protein
MPRARLKIPEPKREPWPLLSSERIESA